MSSRLALLSPLAFSLAVACGGSDGAISGDELETPPACLEDPGACAPITVRWNLRDPETLDEVTCDQVGIDTVELEVTPAGFDPKFATYDCSALQGLTPPLTPGAYNGRVRLFADGGMVAESEADLANVEISDAEHDSFYFAFDCTGPRACENRTGF